MFVVKPRYYIGIDTGVNTGIAIWDRSEKKFIRLETRLIHQCLNIVRNEVAVMNREIFVRVEDARQRKWFGNTGKEKSQGVGSIKRDAKIWEDFLKDNEIPFEMVAPKNNKTKLNSASFKQITKWVGQTSVHARDAAMLVFNF